MQSTNVAGSGGFLNRTLSRFPKRYRKLVLVLFIAPKAGYIYLVGKYLVAKKAIIFTVIGIGETVLGQ